MLSQRPPLLESVDTPLTRGIQRALSCTNVVFTGAVVSAFLVLGACGLYLFLGLYSSSATETKVASHFVDGVAGEYEANTVYRTLKRSRLNNDAGGSLRDPSKPLLLLLESSSSGLDYTQPIVFDIRSIAPEKYRFWLFPVDRTAQAIDVSSLVTIQDGGVYLEAPSQSEPYDVVGSVQTKFLFKPKVLAWENASPTQLAKRFSKTGVAVWSLFLGLATFSLCVAFINRSFLFLIFSAWLVASIRVAGFNSGWDFNWLGVNQWEGFAFELVRMSIAGYAFLTCILFNALFGESLKGSWVGSSMRVAVLAFGLLIVLGAFVPLDVYMTIFRLCAAVSLLTIAAGVVKVLRQSNSAIAWLYACSYALMVAGMMFEILFQANLLPALGDVGINATGGALASAIVMSVALAAQIREERHARLKARMGELKALKELEGVYTQTPVGLFSVGLDGTLKNANPTFREMFDDSGLNDSVPSFLSLWKNTLERLCLQATPQTPQRHVEFSLTGKIDNERRWYVADLAVSSVGYAGSIHDITARKRAESKLEFIARHDPVTDALNVVAFENLVTQYIEGESAAVIGQVGIDRFDYLHKIHGRAVAEGVLVEIVRMISTALPDAHLARDHDKVFMLVPGDVVHQVKAALAAGFRRVKDEGFTIGHVELMPILSGGLCLLECDGTAGEAILRTSLACEIAQNSPAQPIVVAELNENDIIRELEATRMAGGLEDYIKAGRFFLVAQPIVDMRRSGGKPAFELLLRMRGEAGETIAPWQFVPAAEKMGVMSTLDRFVLAEACRLVKSGELCMDQVSHIAVNLSGSSLNDVQFLGDIYDLLSSTNIDLGGFCFEVTESVALNSFERTKEFLGALRSLGAKTAIDDFGAGHSSIHYLAELSPDYLKIDGSLITKVLSHPIHRSFVKKMVELADEMGLICVAEFVETEALEAELIDIGVQMGQGYYYSAPMPIDQMKTFCARWETRSCMQRVNPKTSDAAL